MTSQGLCFGILDFFYALVLTVELSIVCVILNLHVLGNYI